MSVGTSSSVLKRLAYLNRSGILARPLQYSQVKGSLDSLGEEGALSVLQQLEEEAEGVSDPVAFVKNAATEASAEASGAKRKAESGGEGIIAKRVRLLNGSGALAQPIAFGKVGSALSSLGVAQAMTILKGLEDVAEDVSDPTAYIRTAVRGAGGVVPSAGQTEEPQQDRSAPVQSVKTEAPGQRWSNNEGFSEAEKLERRVQWLNRNGGLPTTIEFEEVLPALSCIGTRQAMRVLRRLEESAATVTDPNGFIQDMVARSGWIWSKPDVIDDDEKVAKRVTWMNLFSGLMQPIDYSEVADVLDSLKVPHAMVLLRELEVQANKVENPTEYIKRTAQLAGEDEVHVSVVDEDSSVAQYVNQLNQSGRLHAPIEFSEVGEDLTRIGDEHAMQLLQEVEAKGTSVKDPTGYIKFKLKAKLASLGTTLEEAADDETKILKRIEWLNDYGGLTRDIDYDRVATALQGVGVEQAMVVLKELEDKRNTVQDPNTFVLGAVASTRARPAPPKAPAPARGAARPAPAAKAAAKGASSDLATLSGFVGFLNKNSKTKRPVKFSELAHALDSLGPERAARVLQEMQEKGLGLEDPVTYIKAAAQRSLRGQQGAAAKPAGAPAAEEGDDVAKITKRLNWLNQFGGFVRKVKVDEVVGALYCLGLPQSMAILRGLQERGAAVPDPTSYIKVAVQRANGLHVAAPAMSMEDEEAAEAEEEAAAEAEAEDDDGDIEEFEEPEAEGEDMDEVGAEEGEAAPVGEEEVDMEDDYGAEEPAEEEAEEPAFDAADDGMEEEPAPPVAPKSKAKTGERRVVGGLTGYTKLFATRPGYAGHAAAASGNVKREEPDEAEGKAAEPEAVPQAPASSVPLPLTPQEKLVQIRDLAVKCGLELDQVCIKALSRLPYHRAKDLIDDVLLGGKDRRGVTNPSRYLTIAVEKLSVALGVEQGIAMELAVSLGVVLNNEALDELACIPRKESHAIIRELSKNADARTDPIRFIVAEVMKCRAQMDARPWPPTR